MAVVFDDRTGAPERPIPGSRRGRPATDVARTRRAPAPEALPHRPLRSLRPRRNVAEPMRTRAHGGAARRNETALHDGPAVRTTVWPRHQEPMVRLTAGVVAGPPPPLVVVPRRRRVSRWIAVGFAVVFALMMAAAAFQTQLARRQVELDKVERSIRDANLQYNDLRRQRSELRSPERLAAAARDLGMRPATSTDFVAIDPAIIAVIQQSTGGVFDDNAAQPDALDEYGRVKAITGSAP